ncbi:MAG: hypothetical protein M3462_09415 [Chloroflexota bacterium]|nr:hypothetical protein [Chloroflexota bacterium]
MTTYGLIVSLVVVAALTVLVAALADRPEWRVPRRRRPVLSLATVGIPKGAPVWALDPSRPAWDAALAETSARAAAAGLDGWSEPTPVGLDAVMTTRPTLVIIDGMAALALSGTPLELVRDELVRAVAGLASHGSRSVVLGVATPAGERSAGGPPGRGLDAGVVVRRRDQRDLVAGWNDQVAAGIAPYGAVVVTDPAALDGVVGRLARVATPPELPGPTFEAVADPWHRLA